MFSCSTILWSVILVLKMCLPLPGPRSFCRLGNHTQLSAASFLDTEVLWGAWQKWLCPLVAHLDPHRVLGRDRRDKGKLNFAQEHTAWYTWHNQQLRHWGKDMFQLHARQPHVEIVLPYAYVQEHKNKRTRKYYARDLNIQCKQAVNQLIKASTFLWHCQYSSHHTQACE